MYLLQPPGKSALASSSAVFGHTTAFEEHTTPHCRLTQQRAAAYVEKYKHKQHQCNSINTAAPSAALYPFGFGGFRELGTLSAVQQHQQQHEQQKKQSALALHMCCNVEHRKHWAHSACVSLNTTFCILWVNTSLICACTILRIL